MVSQQKRASRSRDRLLSAAAAEFAARGFDGAKVDRIAARARVNKAMIYYHFGSKAQLYREILLGVFTAIADAVDTGVTDVTPEGRLGQFIRAVADHVTVQPRFAAMWLREMADGGVHIDEAILAELRRVLGVLGDLIEQGHHEGRFQAAHPLITQLGIVAPILFFAASAPVRQRVARKGDKLAMPRPDDLLRHIEVATLGALRAPTTAAAGDPAGGSSPTVRRQRR